MTVEEHDWYLALTVQVRHDTNSMHNSNFECTSVKGRQHARLCLKGVAVRDLGIGNGYWLLCDSLVRQSMPLYN
jgi:hypothetical protein